MATFRKRNDKWQARVQRSGQSSIAKSFHSKADALKWARNVESQLDLGTLVANDCQSAKDDVQKYANIYLNAILQGQKGASVDGGSETISALQIAQKNVMTQI